MTKFYSRKKNHQTLVVGYQNSFNRHGVKGAHFISAIRMLTNCLGKLSKLSDNPLIFAERARLIISHKPKNIIEEKISDLFPECITTSSHIVQEILTLNRLFRRKSDVAQQCFDFIPKDPGKTRDEFLNHFVYIVRTIINTHVREVCGEIYLKYRKGRDKENIAPISSSKKENPAKMFLPPRPHKRQDEKQQFLASHGLSR